MATRDDAAGSGRLGPLAAREAAALTFLGSASAPTGICTMRRDLLQAAKAAALSSTFAVALAIAGCGDDPTGATPVIDADAGDAAEDEGKPPDDGAGACSGTDSRCEGQVAVTCMAGGIEESIDCTALGLVCDAGACRTSLDDLDCVQFRQLRPVQTNTPLPASILTAFAVDRCASPGELPQPVVGLRLDDERADFEIFEDGQPISVFESAARIFNDRRTEVFVSLVMDNSPSVAASGALAESVEAAKALVDSVFAGDSGGVRMRVAFFSKAYAVQQDFTSDPSEVKAALDALLTDETGSNTTNLYGALVSAIDASEQAQTQRRSAMRDGVLTLGQVILFTDGSDQAAVATLAQAQSAVQATADDVMLVALGGELNTDVLSSLGKSGWGLAETADQLSNVFATLAQRIKLLQQRVYVLGYCSPKLAGTHELTVQVKGATGSSAPISFDASTFDQPGASCSAQAFATACDGLDCGGLLCGGCAGAGLCTEALACVCPNDHYALPDCLGCAARFTGPDCQACASERFTGPECDQCAAGFEGDDCAECTDPRFALPDCKTTCSAKFTGPGCTQCADPKFTGPTCEQCAPPWSGEACDQCTPSCAGKACGDDGCGGSCGECPGDLGCVAGQCQCMPQCDGKTCGPDGCGGTCGTCGGAAPYCLDGVCEATCDPKCDGKDCGDDGCGGSCGACPGAAPFCVAGQCALTECPAGCEGQQCACAAGLVCVDGACDPCPAICEGQKCGCDAGQVCSERACCSPKCSGKACGDDGCGGSCGTCAGGLPCMEDQTCCVPDCAGKECGDDGCGGSCGACPSVAPYCAEHLCATEPCPDGCVGKTCGCQPGQACSVDDACIACGSLGDPAIGVGAAERCDGKDNDCDGQTDVRAEAVVASLCYAKSTYSGPVRKGDLVAVPCGDSSAPVAQIWSLADPAAPVLVGSLAMGSLAQNHINERAALHWEGDELWTLYQSKGPWNGSQYPLDKPQVRRYDVSDPSAPVQLEAGLSWSSGHGVAFDFTAAGDRVVVSHGGQVSLFRLKSGSFSSPVKINASGAQSMAIVGDLIYLLSYGNLFVLDDTAFSGIPPTVGNLQILGADRMGVWGGKAYVLAGPHGADPSLVTRLDVVDLSNPASLKVVGTQAAFGDDLTQLFLTPPLALLTGPSGYEVLDLGAPQTPKSLLSSSDSLLATNFAVALGPDLHAVTRDSSQLVVVQLPCAQPGGIQP